jgi:general L-amino acid transport system substrate-binding protein
MHIINKIIVSTLILLTNICSAKTLDDVMARGKLICGVSHGIPGFSVPNAQGEWSGMDIDLCRALAISIFNDPSKVSFVPLDSKERFTALQSGEIDLLMRNTSWTITRNTALNLDYTGVIFYDGQGFMVNKAAKIVDINELVNGSICVQSDTTSHTNAVEHFKMNKKITIMPFPTIKELLSAYQAHKCSAISDDRSALAGYRSQMSEPNNNLILNNIISKEPISPAVRQGDAQWSNIIRWVIYGLINAEELGISKENLKNFESTKNTNIKQFLGYEGNLYASLGLKNTTMRNIIATTGNYGEIFEKNLGSKSNLKIERNLNNLWSNGGLMFSPVFR